MAGASVETTLELWASSLRDVKARIRPLFSQKQVAASAGKFLDGLFGSEPRKTGWMRAEAAGDSGPWLQQAILGRGRWDADALRDIVREYALETLADQDAVLRRLVRRIRRHWPTTRITCAATAIMAARKSWISVTKTASTSSSGLPAMPCSIAPSTSPPTISAPAERSAQAPALRGYAETPLSGQVLVEGTTQPVRGSKPPRSASISVSS